MPKRLPSDGGRNLWISVAEMTAAQASGHLPGLAEQLSARLRDDESCVEAGEFHSIDAPLPDPATVPQLVRQNNVIVLGRVTGVDQGIYANFWKGHLVRMRVETWLRLPDDPTVMGARRNLFSSRRDIDAFFFYAGGAVTTADGVEFCRQRGWADPPSVGARVMVFSQLAPTPLPGGDRNELLLGTTPIAKDIVFDTSRGVRTSPGLQEFQLFRGLDFDFILDEVKQRMDGVDVRVK